MVDKKILVVDDEKQICALIKSHLEKEQYTTYMAYDGETALDMIHKTEPDLIILDVMLPDMNGVDLCLAARKITDSPIIFLSCKSEEIDKIIALSVGGDDYITKPFQSGELIARIKANLRRSKMQETKPKGSIYEYAGLCIDVEQHKVLLDGAEINLTPKEFDILVVLAESPKRVFSMDQLFELVWRADSLSGDSRTIMVYISHLRKKIEPEGRDVKYIINVRGVGYKFNHGLSSN